MRREIIDRRRQERLEEGGEWNSDDEAESLVPDIAEDFLSVPEHIARRAIRGYTAHEEMKNVYQISLFNRGADDNVPSYMTV